MLRSHLDRIARESGALTLGVAFHDYETEMSWSYRGDRWFHAASTIKVAVLVALFDAVRHDRFGLDDRLHVRNRFLSLVDGEPFRVDAGRDANDAVHAAIGKSLRLNELARHMIVTSSNLATNLLLDLIGVEAARESLHRLSLQGVALRRGVEDEKAWEAGLNNEVTATGLLQVFRHMLDREAFSEEACEQMLAILKDQAFTSGIPAGLPEGVRDRAVVAHKTGEISTAAHDAGIVYLPDRKPYILAILTEWAPDASGRSSCLQAVSRAVYDHLNRPAGDEEDADG